MVKLEGKAKKYLPNPPNWGPKGRATGHKSENKGE